MNPDHQHSTDKAKETVRNAGGAWREISIGLALVLAAGAFFGTWMQLRPQESEGGAPTVEAAPAVTLTSPDDTDFSSWVSAELRAFAAVGFSVGEKIHLNELNWNEAEFDAFMDGLRQHFRGDPRIRITDKERSFYEAINISIQRAQSGPALNGERSPLEDLATRLGMEEMDSGIFARIVRGGSGARPTMLDSVKVSISARTIDDFKPIPELSSDQIQTRVADLLPGLAAGVQLLALEGEATILVPPELSYGEGSWPAATVPGSPMLFIVRLHDVFAADGGNRPQ